MSTIPAVDAGLAAPPGMVTDPIVHDLPAGYALGVTRYADVILREAFPQRFRELVEVLAGYRIRSSTAICSTSRPSIGRVRWRSG